MFHYPIRMCVRSINLNKLLILCRKLTQLITHQAIGIMQNFSISSTPPPLPHTLFPPWMEGKKCIHQILFMSGRGRGIFQHGNKIWNWHMRTIILNNCCSWYGVFVLFFFVAVVHTVCFVCMHELKWKVDIWGNFHGWPIVYCVWRLNDSLWISTSYKMFKK